MVVKEEEEEEEEQEEEEEEESAAAAAAEEAGSAAAVMEGFRPGSRFILLVPVAPPESSGEEISAACTACCPH